MDWLKENWFKIIFLISVALLLGNYLYTFSGFVAYTETERRGCGLLQYILSLSFDSGKRADRVMGMSKENQEIVSRYIFQFHEQGDRCKTIQQFYIEQGLIGLIVAILFFGRRKIVNNGV